MQSQADAIKVLIAVKLHTCHQAAISTRTEEAQISSGMEHPRSLKG
jgi:hypothetical protein